MNTPKKPSVLLVARVSEEDQRPALVAQKLRLEDYAKKKGWHEHEDYTYIEFDETAFNKKARKTFNELVIKPLEEDEALRYVVFDKIDRFSRDTSSSEKASLTRLFRKGKIEIHFPHDNLFISVNSPAADLFRLDIGVALAAYYSNSISNNVKRRFDQMLKQDKIWTHQAPRGYKNIQLETKSSQKPIKDIVVDEERAHYIVKAFELRAQGMPYGMIAKELVRTGYTSRHTGRNQISKADIEKMISGPNSKFYYGVMTQNGKEYPHKYPPLIDRALYNRCQYIKDKRGHEKTKWNSLDYTFSGILRCGKCGRSVSSFRSQKWVYLTCANSKCKNKNTAESLVLGTIEALMKDITIPQDKIAKVIDELKKNHDDQQLYYSQSIESVRSEYDSIDKKLESWFDKLVDEKITPEQYDKIVESLKKRQELLNDKLDALTKGNKDFLVTASYLLDLIGRADELFKIADEGRRSKLIGFLVSNLQLNDKKLSFTVNYPFNKVIEAKEKSQNDSDSSLWCGYRDSNPGPRPWQGRALNN